MQVGPRLELKQTQQLVMTPQLQQAIKLLQMSSLDVGDYVAAEVERNPVLTLDGGEGEAPAPEEAGRRSVDREIGRAEPGGGMEELDTGGENLSGAADRLGVGGEPTYSWAGVGAGGAGGGDGFRFEDAAAVEITLRDHLRAQIRLQDLPNDVRALTLLLVDELDGSGYLRTDLEALSARLGANAHVVAAAATALQRCEPNGIGARSLAECLTLQLIERDRFDPAMAALVARLDDLAAARIDDLKQACGVDDEDLADMIAEIRALDPRPGSAFAVSIAQTVIPDVLVRPVPHGGWAVELNADALPKVLIDTRYEETLNEAGETTAKSFVAECRQNADWLIRALDQRAQTILKVGSEIARRQSLFFTEGVSGLRPMTLRDVAESIGMHESTVSRVTANKHLSCERGLFEMKFFFTQAIPATDGGDAISAESVRHRIKVLIENEEIAKPLSDDRIVKLLKQCGVKIARRTVAKYREGMNIPSSAQRKRMKAASLDW